MDARGGKTQPMKIITLLAFALAIIGGIVGTAGLILATSARDQITQDQRVIRSEQAALNADHSALNDAQAQLSGQHRDLITCGDLQQLQMAGIDSNQEQVTVGYQSGGGINAVTLPPHCINQ